MSSTKPWPCEEKTLWIHRTIVFKIIKLLQKMGYGAFREDSGKVTVQIGDDGIDGIIYQDRLGLETVYIQAKRYSNGTVGSPEIRNFIGSLALKGVSKGVFLTTSRFSESSTRTANESKQQKIVLLELIIL